MQKQCLRCLKSKDLSEFHKTNNTKDKRQRICAECMRDHNEVQHLKKLERVTKLDKLPGSTAAYLLNMARKRARDKGLECTIQAKDIHVPEVCPILQLPMERHTGKVQNNNFSLDRLDSTKGYIPGNVRVISWRANYIKNNLSVEQLERLLAYMKGEL